VRWLRWISGAVWVFSWYTIYMEIFRWHHMTRSLRFQAPAPMTGMHAPARAGMPVRAVRLASVAAPVVFLTATIAEQALAGQLRSRRSRGGC
jgi:hypothetical protein